MTEGRKDDRQKPRYDLEPQDARAGMIDVLTHGAAKYGDRNWEAGMNWSRCYAALQRHMAAWFQGEDDDPETGLSHLDHAACCVAFLSAYSKRGAGTDDRPKRSGTPNKPNLVIEEGKFYVTADHCVVGPREKVAHFWISGDEVWGADGVSAREEKRNLTAEHKPSNKVFGS